MKVRYYKLNIREIIILVLLLLFMFNGAIINTYPIFAYIDDFAIIAIILATIIKIIKDKGKLRLEKNEKNILLCYILIYMLGILGNISSQFQNNKIAILLDMLSWTKFFIAYICLVNIINPKRVDAYYDYLIKIGKILIIIGVILEILNLFTDIKLVDGYEKYGLKAFSLGGHPAFTSAILAGFTSILLVEPKRNKIWIIFGLLLAAATLRSKAIAYVCLVIYALIFLRKNINIIKILMLGILVIAVGWTQIQYYFLNENATRARALNISLKIATDYFPTGSGFASFGTNMSGKYYSKAYEKYGLSERWGFTEENYSYVSDGGWATIIAQFGYIGTIIFLCMLIFLILSIKDRVYGKNNYIVPYIALIGYVLISSTNETAFSSNYAVFYGILLAIIALKTINKGRKGTSIEKYEEKC